MFSYVLIGLNEVTMEIRFKGDNGPVDDAIHDLIEAVGGVRRPGIVREMILASLKAGQEDDGRVDLKLMNTSLKEMRFTAKAFSAYRDVKKVTVFGSARTQANETAYQMASLLGSALKMVARPMSPRRRRTHTPSLRSIAG